MATFVPCASVYGRNSVHSLQLFGQTSRGGDNMSLFAYRGPNYPPRPRLQSQKMTLRQICRMLRVMKKIRKREAKAAATAAAAAGAVVRKQGSAVQTPTSPGLTVEKRCVPSCLRRKRSLKRAR